MWRVKLKNQDLPGFILEGKLKLNWKIQNAYLGRYTHIGRFKRHFYLYNF